METFAKRYLVIADPDTRGSYFVYDRLLRRVVTGLVERSEATSLAAHMEQGYRRAREQIEAEATYDFPEYERSASQADREYQFRSEQ